MRQRSGVRSTDSATSTARLLAFPGRAAWSRSRAMTDFTAFGSRSVQLSSFRITSGGTWRSAFEQIMKNARRGLRNKCARPTVMITRSSATKNLKSETPQCWNSDAQSPRDNVLGRTALGTTRDVDFETREILNELLTLMYSDEGSLFGHQGVGQWECSAAWERFISEN